MRHEPQVTELRSFPLPQAFYTGTVDMAFQSYASAAEFTLVVKTLDCEAPRPGPASQAPSLQVRDLSDFSTVGQVPDPDTQGLPVRPARGSPDGAVSFLVRASSGLAPEARGLPAL